MCKRYIYLVLCVYFLFVFSSCLDERIDVGSNNEPSVQLSISGTQDISVYSTATTSENIIGDCAVLLYRGALGSNYVDKEVIDVSKIVNNGSASPLLPQLTIEPQTGDRMYVICNAHLLSIPTTVTENDFNTVFRPNDGYYFGGEQLPMFGKISSWSSTSKTCVMTREVAKIQVQMGTSVPDNTPNFTLDRLFYVVYNGGDSCNIEPSPSGAVLGTPGSASRFTGMSVHRLLQTENATEKELNVYLHEYPSSTKDGAGNTINDNDFAVGRTFILLKKALSATDTMYYRLDFYDSSTKKYLDVKRNCHYLFTINKVRSEGYRTADEAIANPGSNIEYMITISDDAASVTSNGQYALSLTADTVTVRGANGEMLDVLYANYVMPVGADYTWNTGNRNSISLVGSPAGVTLLTTTVTNTYSPVQMQFAGGPTSVSLSFNLGNINRTVVVNYIPLGVWYRIDSSSDDDWVWWGTGTTLPASAATASFDLKTDKGFTFSAAQMTAVNTYVKTSASAIPVDMGEAAYESAIMPNNTFQNNTKLKSFVFPKNITTVQNGSNTVGAFMNCTALTAATGMDNVETLGTFMFRGTGLTSIPIMPKVKRLPQAVFYGCNSLVNVQIAEGITYIGQQCFFSSHNIVQIDLPSTVDTLYQATFGDCYNIAAFYCRATVAPVTFNFTSTTVFNAGTYNGGNAESISYMGKSVLPTSNRVLHVPVGAIKYDGLEAARKNWKTLLDQGASSGFKWNMVSDL